MSGNAAENVIDAMFGQEQVAEPDPMAEVAKFSPANSDLVDLTPEQVRRAQEKGIDPTVVTVAVGRVVGNKIAHLGSFGAEGSTVAGVSAAYGAGLYQIGYRNPSGSYVGARRIHVQADGTAGPPPPLTASVQPFPGSYQRPPAPSPLEAIAYKMLEQKLLGAQEDPMRSTLAEVLKLYALSAEQQRQASAAAAESQRQFLQTMMQIQQLGGQQQPKSDPNADRMFDLFSKLVIADRSKPTPPQPVDQFVKALEFGMRLAGTPGAAAGAADESKDPSWLELVMPAVDSIGPPLVSTIAEAVLDKEKAAAVQETMRQHMQARKAEADADAAIETDGTEVAT